jgi:hypothetical protein
MWQALSPLLQIEFGDEGTRKKVQQAWEELEASRSDDDDDWAMPKVEVRTPYTHRASQHEFAYIASSTFAGRINWRLGYPSMTGSSTVVPALLLVLTSKHSAPHVAVIRSVPARRLDKTVCAAGRHAGGHGGGAGGPGAGRPAAGPHGRRQPRHRTCGGNLCVPCDADVGAAAKAQGPLRR